MSKTTDKAAGLYQAARENDYVNRMVEDKELRESVIDAAQAARKAYARISDSKKGPVDAVTHDRKVQKDLRSAAESLREASDGLRSRRRRSKGKAGKLLLLVLVAAGIALAVSEDARKAVLDALFGPEEEFEYTSTTNGDPT